MSNSMIRGKLPAQRVLVTAFLLVMLAASVLQSSGSRQPGTTQAGTAGGPAKSQIIGHWVAQNRSAGGIGSLWEFNQDGTLRMAPGAIVDVPYRLEGDTLTLPPTNTLPDAKPQIYKVRFEGDNAFYQSFESVEIPYKRTQKGRPEDSPIVGQWKLNVAKLPLQNGAPVTGAMADATYTYTRDGICKLRIPFRWTSGTFDVAKQTFTLNYTDEQGIPKQFTGHFTLSKGQLNLTQPDSHSTDVYVKDDFE
jgi:hypothetical protein